MSSPDEETPTPTPESLPVPDFLIRLVGAQTIQLAAYEQTIRELTAPKE